MFQGEYGQSLRRTLKAGLLMGLMALTWLVPIGLLLAIAPVLRAGDGWLPEDIRLVPLLLLFAIVFPVTRTLARAIIELSTLRQMDCDLSSVIDRLASLPELAFSVLYACLWAIGVWALSRSLDEAVTIALLASFTLNVCRLLLGWATLGLLTLLPEGSADVSDSVFEIWTTVVVSLTTLGVSLWATGLALLWVAPELGHLGYAIGGFLLVSIAATAAVIAAPLLARPASAEGIRGSALLLLGPSLLRPAYPPS